MRRCVKSEISRTLGVPANPAATPPVSARESTLTTGATFQINNAKPFVPVVPVVSINNIS